MLAIPSTGASGRHPIALESLIKRGWTLDVKLDGVRAFSRYGVLVNREGVDITHRYPEISRNILPQDVWLDGEIVAEDNSFETTLRRDAQSSPAKIKRLAEEHPCKFVAFDYLDRAEEGRSYANRRADLESIRDWLTIPITPIGHDLDFFNRTRELGMEGVIAKRPESRYHFGRRSKDWVKFKHLHRVSAIALTYQPGNGQRVHFGAIELAMFEPDGTAVSVGRVGSGFTDAQTWDLKRRIDNDGPFVVEIECLNVTKERTLRFPVFKGIRSDMALTDCTTDQLDTLPTC